MTQPVGDKAAKLLAQLLAEKEETKKEESDSGELAGRGEEMARRTDLPGPQWLGLQGPASLKRLS